MAWRDQLRKASFKGVPFFVESTDGTFGRRVVVHEFPQKAKPYAEDLGPRAREFTIDAFVVGQDYFTARDALLAKLSEAGSGELVHPFLGSVQAVCTEVTLRESSADGGLAKFSLKFVETAPATAPVPKIDTTTALLAAKSGVLASATAYMEKAWAVAGYATFVADKAVEITEEALSVVESGQRKIRGALNTVAELSFKLRKIRANVRDIVAAPGQIATETEAAISLLVNAARIGEGGDAQAASLIRSFFIPSALMASQVQAPASTASQLRIKENAVALQNYIRFVAVANQAESLAGKSFVSAEEAASDRSALLEVIDLAMEDADDEMFSALQSMKVAVTQSVPPPDQTLAREIEIKLDLPTPSLLVAYENFETIESEADLIARNDVRNPAFVSGTVRALNV